MLFARLSERPSVLTVPLGGGEEGTCLSPVGQNSTREAGTCSALLGGGVFVAGLGGRCFGGGSGWQVQAITAAERASECAQWRWQPQLLGS